MGTAEGEARRALARLRRSLVKSERELSSLRDALEHSASGDFPSDAYHEAEDHLRALHEWLNLEEARLRAKVLGAGGIDPGRLGR